MDIDKIDWEKIAQALQEISDTRASCAPLTQQD